MFIAEHYDVLVVGLGPAGAAASYTAAKNGCHVLAIDRKKTVGSPVQCAEFIPLPISRYANYEGILAQPIVGMKSFLPSGTYEYTPFPGLMIDREKFDSNIVDLARICGAEIALGTQLKKFQGNRALLHQPDINNNIEVTFDLLIAADGPHSKVAELLQLLQLKVVHTRQYTVSLKERYQNTDIFLSADYPGGYGWLFPKGTHANLGVGIDKAFRVNLKDSLDNLHKTLVAEDIVGIDVDKRTGGAIPVQGLRSRLVINNCLFVGDAAGLTHPITGAGIAAAIVSGEAAGHAVARWKSYGDLALSEFEEEMFDQFENTLSRAVERRNWLNKYWSDPKAQLDSTHRRGWIAFPEYFASPI